MQQLVWDCMSTAERSCDNLTHSWRASSSVPAECLSGHTVRHRLLTGELAEASERQVGVIVSEEQTDSIFRVCPHPLLRAGQPTFRRVFQMFGPTMAPILLHIQRFFPRGYSGRFVKLTTHLHQMPILKIAGGTPPLPTSSWRPQ